MKSKLIYLGIACLVIFVAAGFSLVDTRRGELRYWQHKEAEIPEGQKPEEEFVTHLPVVSIDTGGEEILWMAANGRLFNSKNELLTSKYMGDEAIFTRNCTISVAGKEGEWHRKDEEPELVENATIRIRGNSSQWFYKKSYLLHFLKEDGEDKNVSVMGMSKASEWVLNGPCLDRTLLRNYLCYNVSGQIMDYAPNVRYCEVFLNGEYQGVYLMVEAITKDEGRVELTKSGKNQAVTS